MVNITDLSKKYKPIEKLSDSVYVIRWNINPVINKVKDEKTGKEEEVISETLSKWSEEYLYGTPTLEIIKNTILQWYNDEIDRHILQDFEWKGMKIWLSQENQFNYKAAYDLAKESNGADLPVTFKFGHDTDIFYEFKTLEELSEFYHKAMKFIQDTLAKGWKTKNSIDWNSYKI